MVPGGTCGSGRGMPDIFDGSIIIGCANASDETSNNAATTTRLHDACLTSLPPHFLQNSASLSLRVPHLSHLSASGCRR